MKNKIRKIKSLMLRIKMAFPWFLSNIAKQSIICKIIPYSRAFLWKLIGVNIGKNVDIGWEVFLDVDYAKYLFIEDDVWIANRSIIFCHRRDMNKYFNNSRYKDVEMMKLKTTIKRGACISIGATILPGVTIGEGAIVGAGAIVTKDVPEWSIVAGNPAKVVRFLQKK